MNNLKVLIAAALFDGHDVSINLFRRLLLKRGAEVIHLGHNRSVQEVIKTALEEDVDGILVSSYQGGHNEYFRYLVDLLKSNNAEHIRVLGGGGGVILPNEIDELQKYGVEKLYHATEGQHIGIDGIGDDIVVRLQKARSHKNGLKISGSLLKNNSTDNHYMLAQELSIIEKAQDDSDEIKQLRDIMPKYDKGKSVVIGVTGTGGSGKSSLIDELIGRFIHSIKDVKIAVLAVDPTKTKTKGALLGDRIRYNQIYNDNVYFRSFATRRSPDELSLALKDSVDLLKTCGFDIIFVETSGIGQGDSKIVNLSDISMYVMTAEYGAPTQLEKIDMLDYADFIAINKSEKLGAEDAYREVMLHYIRTHNVSLPHNLPLVEANLPVYAVSSNHFNNPGINRLFKDLLNKISSHNNSHLNINEEIINLLPIKYIKETSLIPHKRTNYLAEISDIARNYYKAANEMSELAGNIQSLQESIKQIDDKKSISVLENTLNDKLQKLDPNLAGYINTWQDKKEYYKQDAITYSSMGREIPMPLSRKTLSGIKIPKVAFPNYSSWKDISKFYYKENFPGAFPYTAGVFPFKRTYEDPKRQFAGEGGPERTNRRFHFLTNNERAKRLSVAFDGITLYAEDPDIRPDIYGKIGESGVSICTIEDMDTMLDGFDLTDPLTSVSMTINAPAPIMVAFYFMTAYLRELEKLESEGRVLDDKEKEQLKIETFRKLRGTVQADMLKEDQAQNTIIFSIDFAMKLIGDLQEYLSKNKIRNYYSLSISGYHIAEAGANPITQLAFTLANGFTYVEYFLNRGIPVDDFAPNLSFFFSNGMDPEYSVIGRVARRIWAIAMRDRYGANDHSQKLKYHIQTSGRSLHSQEIEFNDIRTTLQALIAFYDNCNSLHTNSYDEAITTPTEESVRRAMAIQLILSKEFGGLYNENPNQGSFIIEELTDLVEEAVLQEFENISRRGGVLGAMENQYQRSKIQEESLYYEYMKQSGEYPIIGVNTYQPENPQNYYDTMQVTRTTDEEKQIRLKQIDEFHRKNKDKSRDALERLRKSCIQGNNIFEELLNTVQYCSMGEITRVLYEAGGKYRRGV
ncbi:MAG TPA: methylmalonyl-CoA mutase [Bacteroidetes bacterium]|nr:methylmalonyl-CoA mutase [Bacteroidota bacterium]